MQSYAQVTLVIQPAEELEEYAMQNAMEVDSTVKIPLDWPEYRWIESTF